VTGGDLISGVAERRDEEVRATGEATLVGLPDLTFDQTCLRLEGVMRT